jgi:hypothetical protein
MEIIFFQTLNQVNTKEIIEKPKGVFSSFGCLTTMV